MAEQLLATTVPMLMKIATRDDDGDQAVFIEAACFVLTSLMRRAGLAAEIQDAVESAATSSGCCTIPTSSQPGRRTCCSSAQ